MTVDPTTDLRPVKRHRRWFRFSLRTILLFATALCLWLGMTVTQARQRERAVKAIEAAGGTVGYDYQYDFAKHGSRNQPRPPGPLWLPS